MNYREHLHVPSAVHIEVSVAGRPEYDRVIELPEHSPGEWLAEAYLLSVGVEGGESDDDEFAYERRGSDVYRGGSWVVREAWPAPFRTAQVGFAEGDFFRDDPPDPAESVMRMEPFPYEVDIAVHRAPRPQVGDAQVSIVSAGADSSLRSGLDWQTSAPPLDVDEANHELARRFGVVLPFFRSQSLHAIHHGISDHSLIADLLAPLTPVRRLALRAHLNATGLLDVRLGDAGVARQASHALRALIDAVGPDGADQDASTGWLPHDVLDRVVAGAEWDDEAAGALLSSFARRAGLMRRLKGRVVVNALGRQLMVDPVKAFPRVVSSIADGSRRYSYSYDTDRFDRAAALLAIADGSAASYDELAGYVEKAYAARDTRIHDEYGGWYDSARSREGSDRGEADRVLCELVDGFHVLSDPGAFGLVTPHIRAVARLALWGG